MIGLRKRLSEAGITGPYLKNFILPDWWDDEAALSESGFMEALGYVKQTTGLSLSQLLNEDTPLQAPACQNVRFKKASDKNDEEVSLATSIALQVAKLTEKAMRDLPEYSGIPDSKEIRTALLERTSPQPWATFAALLEETWARGVAVIFLKNLPSRGKKPDAMATIVKGRPVILIFRRERRPSWMAFLLAHELGHISLGHVKDGEVFIDEKIEDSTEAREEQMANNYASEVLTGHTNLGLNCRYRLTGAALAKQARLFGKTYNISPGVAALNYGFTTTWWPVANAALQIIEGEENAMDSMNAKMQEKFPWGALPEEREKWLKRITSLD